MMPIIKRNTIAGIISALVSLLFLSAQSSAAPIQTTWAGIPGGATFTSSGGPYQSSTPQTWNLFSTDDTQYDQLWFAFYDIAAGMDNSASALTFLPSGIGTDTAIWTGSDFLTKPGGDVPILTRFTATLGGGNTWIDPTTVGIAASFGAVAEWSSSPFTVTFMLEASEDGGSTWKSFFGTFDNNNCGLPCEGYAVSDRSTAYFYTEKQQNAVVPLPAALPLMLSGFGVLGAIGWRKRRKTAA